jgi:hypothetical protein
MKRIVAMLIGAFACLVFSAFSVAGPFTDQVQWPAAISTAPPYMAPTPTVSMRHGGASAALDYFVERYNEPVIGAGQVFRPPPFNLLL